MAPKLFIDLLSPPVRAVLMAEKALGLNFEHIETKLGAGAHLAPEYVKLNPQHTVPLFVDDDGTVVWDSHAIMAYLVGKYGKNDSLYPKDLAKRAVVDQRLHFESSCIFAIIKSIVFPRLRHGQKTASDYSKEQANINYELFNNFLEGKKYACGDELTIADFSLITGVTSLGHLVPIDAKYTNLHQYINRLVEDPLFSKEGHQAFVTFMDAISK